MDVMIPYGICYKNCGKMSYSGYKRSQLLPYLEKNILEKNNENVMALTAELHCSSYFPDLNNFIIKFFSNYLILNSFNQAFFIDQFFNKIEYIKKTIPKGQQKNALINSNEIRNIYCSIFSNFLNENLTIFQIKIEPKCYQQEIYLVHSNVEKVVPIMDSNHINVSDKLSRGLREILYWGGMMVDELTAKVKRYINEQTLAKLLYWINWCYKVEKLEKKLRMRENFFKSNYPPLLKIKDQFKTGWEFFLWDFLWQRCEKNKFGNKNLIESFTSLFYDNYSRNKIKERAGLLAIALLIANYPHKINIERKISKLEIFSNLNANQFYKNVQKDSDNDEKYLELYNFYNNVKDANVKVNDKIYKENKVERKMDFLKEYLPKISENKNDGNNKKISDYFS